MTIMFAKVNEQHFRLQGQVSFANADEVYQAGVALLQKQHECIFDLDALKLSDSSALAVLLAWIRQSRAEQKPLAFQNIPPQLQAFATVCGVDSFIPLTS